MDDYCQDYLLWQFFAQIKLGSKLKKGTIKSIHHLNPPDKIKQKGKNRQKLMFELCRKIVAGPKKKLQWNGKQLDLTYVTDRIIAMAFPASGLESAYRNSIKDVSQYLHQKHGDNYLIINVSSRKYDYKFFNNNVLQYQWRDHLSPPLSTLFQVAREMYEYLKKNKNNVVAVHCNHGKGRTGTTIISFLLFTGFFEKYDEALCFYNKRRFVSLTYGVSQPCQKRYLNYFEILKRKETLSPKLISYKLKNFRQKGLSGEKYYMQISSIRKAEPKYSQLYFGQASNKLHPKVPLIGDICIQIFVDKWKGEEEIAMINCHTFFFDENQNRIKVDETMRQQNQEKEHAEKSMLSSLSMSTQKQQRFIGSNIKVNGKHSLDFEIFIDFEWYCYCHIEMKKGCPCHQQRVVQQRYWQKTVQSVEIAKKITKLEACALLSSIEYLHQNQEETTAKKTTLQKKLSFKHTPPSPQSNKNTQTSPILSQQQKQGISTSDKESNKYAFSNSYDNSQANKTEDDGYGNQEFQYDMVIVNRNSTNSV